MKSSILMSILYLVFSVFSPQLTARDTELKDSISSELLMLNDYAVLLVENNSNRTLHIPDFFMEISVDSSSNVIRYSNDLSGYHGLLIDVKLIQISPGHNGLFVISIQNKNIPKVNNLTLLYSLENMGDSGRPIDILDQMEKINLSCKLIADEGGSKYELIGSGVSERCKFLVQAILICDHVFLFIHNLDEKNVYSLEYVPQVGCNLNELAILESKLFLSMFSVLSSQGTTLVRTNAQRSDIECSDNAWFANLKVSKIRGWNKDRVLLKRKCKEYLVKINSIIR